MWSILLCVILTSVVTFHQEFSVEATESSSLGTMQFFCEKVTRSKYCECCKVAYVSLSKHVSSFQHRMFRLTESNYASLDSLICALNTGLAFDNCLLPCADSCSLPTLSDVAMPISNTCSDDASISVAVKEEPLVKYSLTSSTDMNSNVSDGHSVCKVPVMNNVQTDKVIAVECSDEVVPCSVDESELSQINSKYDFINALQGLITEQRVDERTLSSALNHSELNDSVADSDYKAQSDSTGLSDTDGNNNDNDICSPGITTEVRTIELLRKKGCIHADEVIAKEGIDEVVPCSVDEYEEILQINPKYDLMNPPQGLITEQRVDEQILSTALNHSELDDSVADSDYKPESDCTGLSDTDGNNSDNDICSSEVTIEVRKSEPLKKGLSAEAEC